MRRRIFFICGSMNQTTQMHQMSQHLPEYEHSFSPYYSDSPAYIPRRLGLIEFTIAGNKLAGRCRSYLQNHGLPIDYQGKNVVITGSDLFSPKNIRDRAPAAKSASSNGSRAGRAACPASATITAVAPAAVVTSSVSDANGRAGRTPTSVTVSSAIVIHSREPAGAWRSLRAAPARCRRDPGRTRVPA